MLLGLYYFFILYQVPVQGIFAKLPKAAVSFVMNVRPSVRMEHLCFHWKNFHEVSYLRIFRKPVENIQVSLKSDKNNGNLYEDQYTSMIISCSDLLRMRNVSDRLVEKIDKHILFSISFPKISLFIR
jgi:hypothetical protein